MAVQISPIRTPRRASAVSEVAAIRRFYLSDQRGTQELESIKHAWSLLPNLTTAFDHNGNRHRPLRADEQEGKPRPAG
jgi:hypothetical protein